MPPIRTAPSHGKVLCLELSWKRSAVHGTTMLRLSCAVGVRTEKSATMRSPPPAVAATSTFIPPPSWTLVYSSLRPRKVTVRSTCSGIGIDPGHAGAVASTERPVSKSVNVTWQNAA